MTDHLTEHSRAGALLEQLRRAERLSTKAGRAVDKKGENTPADLHGAPARQPVFHSLHRPVVRELPRFEGTPLESGPAPFSADRRVQERSAPLDAEAVDRAFQRDSRRYDGGFFLY